MKISLIRWLMIMIIGITGCSAEPDGSGDPPPPVVDASFEKQAPGTYIFEHTDPAITDTITYVIDEDERNLHEKIGDIEETRYWFESMVEGDETRAYYITMNQTYIGVEVITGGIENGEAGKTLSLFRDTTLPSNIKDFATKEDVKWDEINRINSTVPPTMDLESFVAQAPGTYTFTDTTDVEPDIVYIIGGDLDLYIGADMQYEFIETITDSKTRAFYKSATGDTYIGLEVVTGGIVNGEAGKTLSLFKDTTSSLDIKDFATKEDVKWEEANRIDSTIPPVIDPNLFIGKAPGTYIFADPDNLDKTISYEIKNDLNLYKDTTKVYDYVRLKDGSEDQAFYKSATGDTYIGLEVVRNSATANSDPATDKKMLSLFKDTSFVIDIKDFAAEGDVKWDEINRINSTVPLTPADPKSFEAQAPGTYVFLALDSGSTETTYIVDKATLDIYISPDKVFEFVSKIAGDETRAYYLNPSTKRYIGVEVVNENTVTNSDPNTEGKLLSLYKNRLNSYITREWLTKEEVVFNTANQIYDAESPAKSWDPVGASVGMSTGNINWSVSAIDSQDNLYVFYEGGPLTVQRYDATAKTWKSMIVESRGAASSTTAITVDKNDNIYVATARNPLGSYKGMIWKATAASLASSNPVWTDVTPSDAVDMGKPALAADPNTGDIYYSYTLADGAYVQKSTDGGNNWTRLAGVIPITGGNKGIFISLAVKSTSGEVYLATGGGNDLARELKIYRWTGSIWESTTAVSIGNAEDVDLKINPKDQGLYVAYFDIDNGKKATVKKLVGDTWVTQGAPGFSGRRADYLKINFDKNGNAVVAYGGDGSVDGPSRAYFLLDNQWEPLGTGQASKGNSYYSALSVASDGTVYLSFNDQEQGGKLTVKQYKP